MASLPHGSLGNSAWLKQLHDEIDWENLWPDLQLEITLSDPSRPDLLREIPFLRQLLDGYEDCTFFYIVPHPQPNFEKYIQYLGYVGHSSWAKALRGIGDIKNGHELSFREHRGILTGLLTCPSFLQFLNTHCPQSEWKPITIDQVDVLENYELDVELIKTWIHNHPNAKIEALRFCQYMFGMNWRDVICLQTKSPWADFSQVDASYLETRTYLIVNLRTLEMYLLVIKQLDD